MFSLFGLEDVKGILQDLINISRLSRIHIKSQLYQGRLKYQNILRRHISSTLKNDAVGSRK